MKTSRLINNMGLYFLSTFSTKMIQLLFIPLYTIFLDPYEFGYYNLVLAVVLLAIPLLYQSIWEGVLRFTIEKSGVEKKVLATTSLYCFGLTFIYGILFFFFSITFKIQYAPLIFLMAITQMGVSYWQFSARALNKNKIYTIANIVNAAVTVILSFILIVVFNWGISALFISNIAGSLVMILIIEVKIKLIFNIRNSKFDKALLKEIIKYSIPLSINAISWWLISTSSSLIISNQIGIEENGIYSIAGKFGAIMTLVTTVVNMAWLEESFRSYGEKGSDAYFNNVLDYLTRIVLSGVAILIPITYIFYQLFVFGEYKTGVILTPIIYLSSAFSTFAAHLGSGFLARKESNIIFQTTLVAGIISAGGGFLLAPTFGLMGVIIASLIGTVVMFWLRVPMLRKRMQLEIKFIRLIGLTSLCILVTLVSNLNKDSLFFQLIVLVITILVVSIINKSLLLTIYLQLKKKLMFGKSRESIQ